MKKVILLVVFLPLMARAQVVENFEQGNAAHWLQYPEGRWCADSTFPIEGFYSLHHSFDNSEASTDVAALPLNNLFIDEGVTHWRFSVRYGYAPSASNNWTVFLVSEDGPAESAVMNNRAFAVGVNLSGYDDTLRLWKVINGSPATVVKSRINWQNDIGTDSIAVIDITRSPGGIWAMGVYGKSGNVIGVSSGNDPELFPACWFLVCYRYTSSCDRLLWIDDILIDGVFHEDISPPSVTSLRITGRKSLAISLDEEPATGFYECTNFLLNGESAPALKVTRTGRLTCSIEFIKDFINRSMNRLVIKKLCDNGGNCISEMSVDFEAFFPEPGDVIISEIMAKPDPSVSLPSSEYLELFNRTGFTINIKKWQLRAGDQVTLLPDFKMDPHSYLILCPVQDTSLFSKYGGAAGIKPFPSLTDAGRIVCLSDSNGMFIHGVEYSAEWYGDELKSGGGWSLEMTDTNFPFFYEGNWKASKSPKGGTPGQINSVTSVNPDMYFYGIRNVFPLGKRTVRISLSEPVPVPANDNKVFNIEGAEVVSVLADDPLLRDYIITTAEDLSEGVIYDLEVDGKVADFAGNSPARKSFRFGLPSEARAHDVLFNEILFNPLPGDPDFAELYNASDRVLDISRLIMVSVNDDTGDTSGICLVSDENRCFLPGGYYACTTGREKILNRYISSDPENVFEVSSMPSMADNEGHIILFSRNLWLVDEMKYNDKMHNSLLVTDEGVSLEKADAKNPSDVESNWHSATELSGWGTPGAPNSVLTEIPVGNDQVSLSSTLITPDGDGNDDFLEILFSMNGNDNVVSADVFDEDGIHVKRIARNLLAGGKATLSWDGTYDDGSNVRNGIYVLLVTIYNETGKTERFKKVCSVVRR